METSRTWSLRAIQGSRNFSSKRAIQCFISARWNKYPDLKDKLGYEFGPDGSWWMRFEDWCTAFTHLYVCRLFPNHWQQHQISGEWHEMTAAGAPVAKKETEKSDPDPRWFNNPQTRITLETDKPTTVFFSLIQSEENPRQPTNLMLLKSKGPRLYAGISKQAHLAEPWALSGQNGYWSSTSAFQSCW